MKKLIFALALLMMGGVSLSTAEAATALPAASSISEAVKADGGLEQVGHRGHHRHRHYRHYHKGHYYNYGYKRYPYGYYDGFCYDNPYHWWCKRYFFKKRYY
jgi:hypothetical protein